MRKTKVLKPFTVYVPTYRAWVFAYVGMSYDDTNKDLFKRFGQTLVGMRGDADTSLLTKPDAAVVVIRLPKFKNKSWWHALFAHECVHAASQILDSVGESQLDLGKSNEFFTYLIQHIQVCLLAEVMGEK